MTHRATDGPDAGEPWRGRVDARDAYALAVEARSIALGTERTVESHTATMAELGAAVTTLLTDRKADDVTDQTTGRWVDDHEARIRSLERWRYALPLTALSSGVAAVASVVAALVASGIISP